MKVKAEFTPLQQGLQASMPASGTMLPGFSQLMYLPVPGITPHIGENGNWWLGDVDTGVSASNCHIPSGGRTGQVLGKNSDEDHDLCWKDPVTYSEEPNDAGGVTAIISM